MVRVHAPLPGAVARDGRALPATGWSRAGAPDRAAPQPQLDPQAVLALQRLAGNRAVASALTSQGTPQGPIMIQRGNGKGKGVNDEEESEEADDEGTEKSAAGQRLRRAAKRAKARNAKRQAWDKRSYRRKGPFGPAGMSRGRGSQPNIGTREKDYGKTKVGTHYGHKAGKPIGFAKHLSTLKPAEQRSAAQLLRRASKGGAVRAAELGGLDARTRRALAFFHHIVHQAEEDPTRNPGSAKLARGGFKAVEEGRASFDAFHGDDSPFLPAREGGTGLTRRVIAEEAEAPEDLATFEEEMSESSDEEDVTVGDYFAQFKGAPDPDRDDDPGAAGIVV